MAYETAGLYFLGRIFYGGVSAVRYAFQGCVFLTCPTLLYVRFSGTGNTLPLLHPTFFWMLSWQESLHICRCHTLSLNAGKVCATEATRKKLQEAEDEKKKTEAELGQTKDELQNLNKEKEALQGQLNTLNNQPAPCNHPALFSHLPVSPLPGQSALWSAKQ